jgi:hypothetical protein
MLGAKYKLGIASFVAAVLFLASSSAPGLRQHRLLGGQI